MMLKPRLPGLRLAMRLKVMVDSCEHIGIILFTLCKPFVYEKHLNGYFLQTVKTKIKYCIIWYFIGVYTVCIFEGHPIKNETFSIAQ